LTGFQYLIVFISTLHFFGNGYLFCLFLLLKIILLNTV